MFRKFLLTSVASLSLLSPLAFAPRADAHEHRHVVAFRVYYRDACHRDWCFGRAFGNHRAAERFAERYRCRGFEVCIR